MTLCLGNALETFGMAIGIIRDEVFLQSWMIHTEKFIVYPPATGPLVQDVEEVLLFL